LIIREATENDLAALGDLHGVCFAIEVERARAEMKEELARPWARIVLAEEKGAEENELLGYAVFWFVADEANLLHIAVSDSARRRGTGRLIMERGLELAREKGTVTCILEVRSSNEAAIGLYRSFDFTDVTTRKAYYADGEDALVMSRRLDQPVSTRPDY